MKASVSNLKKIGEQTAMTIDIIGDSVINANIKVQNIKQVTNPVRFEKGTIPTADGIFSPYIFGHTQEEKQKRFGYIDLHTKVFHPYVYEILKAMYKKIDTVGAGHGSWKIVNGELIEIMEDEPDYDEDATGMNWLVKNFKNIIIEDNTSRIRSERLKLIQSLKDDEIFITKWLVTPIFYRDISYQNGNLNVPEINDYYNNLIRYANSLDRESIAMFSHGATYQIQMNLINIRKYFQELIEKKNGIFKKSVIGKSVDLGYRSVISVPVITNYNTPKEDPIDLHASGIPMSQCAILGYYFVAKWIQDFFRRQFETMGNRFPWREIPGKNGKNIIEYVALKDPLLKYNSDYIKNRIDLFDSTPETRFETISVDLVNGEEAELVFTGTGYNMTSHHPTASGTAYRKLTWADLIYMACVDTCSDKHTYITRYPLVDYFGTFPSRIHVLSTIKTTPMIVEDTIYPFYPVIDPTLSQRVISTLFNDTITMSNAYLNGLGGDYDGDMVTAKMIYSVEANDEAEEILKSVRHYVSIDGRYMRTVGNEVFLTYYEMTK